jgi:hypothetical protein
MYMARQRRHEICVAVADERLRMSGHRQGDCPDAFKASAPQGMLATSLNPQTRHFNLAATSNVPAKFKCRGLR